MLRAAVKMSARILRREHVIWNIPSFKSMRMGKSLGILAIRIRMYHPLERGWRLI